MNSSSAMPISVTLLQLLGVVDQAEHLRPDQRAGDDVAEGRAEPRRRNSGDEDQRGAEHDRAAFEDRGGRLRGLGGRSSPRAPRSPRAAPGTAAGSRRGATCATAPARARRGPASRRARRCSPASQRLSATSACRDLGVRPADARAARPTPPTPGRRRRRGPAATAARRGRSPSSWTASRDPAAAGRRAQLGAAVLALQRARLAERRRQPQDLGRVERRVHSRRQVVPPGPSSKTMPSALSSSRMRSAVGEVAVLLGFGALGDAALRSRCVVAIALEPFVRRALRAGRAAPALAFNARRIVERR